MAITYQVFGNSPCSISRGMVGLAADGALRAARVGTAGAAAPGTTGSIVNEVFFRKLKDAARILSGAVNDAGLSGVSLANVFWLATREGNESLEATLQGSYPNGRLLDLPFIEQAMSMTYSNTEEPNTPALFGVVIFETTVGDAAPSYADFIFTVPTTTDNTDTNNVMIKLFHTLTA